MREKILGFLSLVGSVLFIILLLYLILYSTSKPDSKDIPLLIAMFVYSLSTILYVIFTRFGSVKVSELRKIQIDNKILEEKVHQKELKAKLSE